MTTSIIFIQVWFKCMKKDDFSHDACLLILFSLSNNTVSALCACIGTLECMGHVVNYNSFCLLT